MASTQMTGARRHDRYGEAVAPILRRETFVMGRENRLLIWLRLFNPRN